MKPETDVDRNPSTLPSLFDYAAGVTADSLEKMLTHVEGVRRSDETEPVHQMRVSSRRARAALEVFVVCFDSETFIEIGREVKVVTQALGEARDLDVMIETLGERAEALSPEQRPAVDSFIERARQHRHTLQKSVAKIVTRLEQRDPFGRFEALVTERRGKTPSSGRARRPRKGNLHAAGKVIYGLDMKAPIFANSALIIGTRLQEMLAYERYLSGQDNVYELHQMRIAAKRLRYTMELFESLYADHTAFGAEFSAVIVEIETLQKRLGQIHDSDVLVPLLAEHLSGYLQDGYGKGKNGEPIAGVHHVNLDACEGLLTLWQETRASRDKHYQQAVDFWHSLWERQIFDNLRGLLRAAVLTDPASVPTQTAPAKAEKATPVAAPAVEEAAPIPATRKSRATARSASARRKVSANGVS